MIHFKLHAFLIIAVGLFFVEACSLVNSETDGPKQTKAGVDELAVPNKVHIGVPFEIKMNGTTGCKELARVQKSIIDNQIFFTVWIHEKDKICGVIPGQFNISKTLTFQSAGTYQIIAGDKQQTVIAM